MKTGGEPVFDFMWKRYINSNVPNEQYTILTAMGCTREKKLLQRFVLTESGVLNCTYL